MSRALFIGRFQPFHNGHLHVVKSILKDFDEIIIGIGSSQEKNTKENPFSYKERKSMIEKTFRKEKIKNFKIFPVPDLYDDRKWVGYIQRNLPKYDCVLSGNKWTIECFKKHDSKVRKIRLIKGISSTKIRELIRKGKPWQKLVPKEISEYLTKIGFEERIRDG